MRFDEELLTAVADDPNLGALVRAEIVDPVMFAPRAEYAFATR